MTDTGRQDPQPEPVGPDDQEDEVDRLDRELAVANDLGPEDGQKRPEPGRRPSPDEDRAGGAT